MVRRSAARLTMQLRFHVYCTSIVATLILPLDHLDCRRLKISWIQKNFSTFQSGNISRAPCCTYLHIYEMVYTYMRWFTHIWDGLHICKWDGLQFGSFLRKYVRYVVFEKNAGFEFVPRMQYFYWNKDKFILQYSSNKIWYAIS